VSWRISLIVGVGVVLGILAGRYTQDSETGTASWDGLRAAGFAAYACLWLSVCTGIAVHLRFRPGPMAITWLLEGHRITSSLGLSFLAGHLVGLLVDPTISFKVVDIAVGLTSSYRPWQMALGAAAFWSLVTVLASTAFSRRLPYSAWRNLHYLSFPAYGLALVHGLTAGTDASSNLAMSLYASTGAVVAALLVVRVLGRGWAEASAGSARPTP